MENAELVGTIQLLDQDTKDKVVKAIVDAGFRIAYINENDESVSYVILQDK